MFGQFRLYGNFEIIIWGFLSFLDNYINFIFSYLKENKSSVTFAVKNIFGRASALKQTPFSLFYYRGDNSTAVFSRRSPLVFNLFLYAILLTLPNFLPPGKIEKGSLI